MDDSSEKMIKGSGFEVVDPLSPKKNGITGSYPYQMAIGGLGALLPILLILTARIRPIEGKQPWDLLGSISAYWYTDGMIYFVGILIFLGVFLIMYFGYGNKLDRFCAKIAGIAAIGVAIFPTKPPPEITHHGWDDWMGGVHLASAIVFFSASALISFFLFIKSKVSKENRTLGKRLRNKFYRICGGGMAVCLALIFYLWLKDEPIFWPETFALWFFAASWLVKGQADRRLVSSGKQTLHYSKHPGRLAIKIRDLYNK